MNIDGIPTRTLRAHPEQRVFDIIDQTRLPHARHWVRVGTLVAAAHAIRAMQVRGAPLIRIKGARLELSPHQTRNFVEKAIKPIQEK